MYSVYGNLDRIAGAFGILMLIAFVASIVVTVMLYSRYAANRGESVINLSDRRTWGPFLRFDTLLIERILKVFYIFLATFSAFSYVAIALSSFAGGFGVGLGMLIGGLITLIVSELVLRVAFESMMLRVIIARNTSEISRQLGSGETPDADGISNPSVPPAAAGRTCPNCGTHVPDNAQFCRHCGTRL